MAMNSTEHSFECGKSRTPSASSSLFKTGQHDGFKQSPHTFSRGNFSRSSTSDCKPAIAQNAAQLDPAGPPPTIATSKACMESIEL
jgi:hypothetical protein